MNNITKTDQKNLSNLSDEKKEEVRLQSLQEKEIKLIFKNLGFIRVPKIGRNFIFQDRQSQMDDIFICENVIIITEYTITKDPGEHLKNKIHFYNKVLNDKNDFISFLISSPKMTGFKDYYDLHISNKYSLNQLHVVILYCSKFSVSDEHKKLIPGVKFFDYHIVQYFKSLTRTIKKSGKYEFMDFLCIPYSQFGVNVLKSELAQSNKFTGHILPEEKSSFKEGYKIVSFYIDAESLMRRSYVLRQEGWRDEKNIGYYQRMFESKKISSMRKYLIEKGRVFINNIIATISEKEIKLYDTNDNLITVNDAGQFTQNSGGRVIPAKIEITDGCNIIGLIDGQHRTYAYHEGDDSYEIKIKSLRTIQNLLVTGIIFPRNEKEENRLKFEANLFLEINSNQTNVKSRLKQEIELMISPFSSIAIGKRILFKLNENGPVGNLIEKYSFEKGKLKTASIVSFGLRPLIKLDENALDCLFSIWDNTNKHLLKDKDSDRYDLLDEYVEFCVVNIRNLLIAFRFLLDKDKWSLYSRKTPNGVLGVTFFNGVLNILRLLIENNKLSGSDDYKNKLEGINDFDFRKYKSSQYRQMGKVIYDRFFR